MDQNQKAWAIFEEARRLYLQEQFKAAREQMAIYRRTVDYDFIPRRDRRTENRVHSSVIIVSFGSGLGLVPCLESVLSQSDQGFEVILVDNGGNEDAHRALANLPLLWLSSPINLLPSEGRNVGAHFARGEHLIFLDDDATMCGDYLERAREAMESYEFLILRGRVSNKTNPPQAEPPAHYDLGAYPIPAVPLTEGNMVISREVFSSVGGFDSLLFGHEGAELASRCLEKFPGREVYYWPSLVVYHDFASGERLQAKQERQVLARKYLRAVSPFAASLSAAYRRWYASRPETVNRGQVSFSSGTVKADEGVSIIIRGGENILSVKKWLESFVRYNTHKPVEILIPAHKPQEALSVIKSFISHVLIRLIPPEILSEQGSLAKVAKAARYEQILFADKSAVFERDLLPELIRRLKTKKVEMVNHYQDESPSFLLCRRKDVFDVKDVSAKFFIQEWFEQFTYVGKLRSSRKYPIPYFSDEMFWRALLMEKKKMIEKDFREYRFR